jgi:nickel transport protein
VFAPSDPRVPFQKGRTDRAGWLAFVPSEPGGWRVQVVDATGHGLAVEVPGEPGAPEGAARRDGEGSRSVPRTLAAVVAIAAIFTGLLLFARSRRSP